MAKEKITIITVTYNCIDILENTINSCINQNYDNIEYLIIDGASTDGTLDIIKKYSYKITKWISEPDKGIFDAMNKGIKMASGDWVIFMNAGDYFYQNNVLSDIFAKEDLSEFGVIHGRFMSCSNNQLELIDLTPFYKNTKSVKGMGFSHQACFVRTTLARDNLFSSEYKFSADYNQLYNLYYKNNIAFKQVDTIVAVMQGDDGATQRNYIKHLNEVCKICKNASFFAKLLFKYKLLFKFYIRKMLKL